MRKLFTIISILFLGTAVYSQKLSQVSFPNGAQLSFFSILTDQGVQIRISEDGKILEWGMEVMSERYNYYAPRLQPFMARTEYYPPDSDSAFKGKVKSIGTCFITYYGAHEEANKKGKLKSLGILQFDYYSNYDDKSMQGKLKFLGNLYLEYYRPYDNEAFRGKLKSIGSVPIIYYSAFDDKYNIGKIKSIGSVPYSWYSPYDLNRSGLKSNNYRNNISGITFILQ
jgi:hypothetical protein